MLYGKTFLALNLEFIYRDKLFLKVFYRKSIHTGNIKDKVEAKRCNNMEIVIHSGLKGIENVW